MRRVAATAVVLALGVPGCGSGESPPGTGGGASNGGGVTAVGGQDMVDAQLALARCMRRQGIDFPDPRAGRGFEFDPGDTRIDARRMRAAERKCAPFARAVAEAAPQPS